MKKKGFTLIELLAVIVILSVLMVIAVPKILNVIENSKKSAVKSSAELYIDAINKNNALYEVDSSKYQKIEDGEIDINTLSIEIKGEGPTSGTVNIEKGKVKEASLCVNDYNIEYNNGTAKVNGKCNKENLTGEPILEKAKTLVYKNNACKTDGTTYNYMGGCYIKGSSSNNYVWYNGFMWRIMGINSDNTVRLIVDENITAISYGDEKTAESYLTNEGYIHDWLNEYFYSNLNSTKSIIKKGSYFCSETTNGSTLTTDTVRTTCTKENEVKAKVGLITYDEYLLADTTSSYLNIGQTFWTMTPNSSTSPWIVILVGYINQTSVTSSFGVRPVINVDPESIITKGNGEVKNCYVLAADKTSDKTGTIGENVTSGEYVKLENKTYRVVSKDSDGIKLILDGYYDSEVVYGDDNIFTTQSGIGATLNNEVLTWLGLDDSEKIVETTWYQGETIKYPFKYTDILSSTTNSVKAKVGLITVGEMLSAQSSTLLTKKYEQASSYNNTIGYWMMNKYTDTSVASIMSVSGDNNSRNTTKTSGVRPVIKVKSNLTISGGTGTWDNPYEI